MRITEARLRQIIRETLANQFREELLARKKYYDDLARQPLPYKEGATVRVNDTAWVGTVRGIPVIIEPGTILNVLALPSTTDGAFTLQEPATLQVTETAVRMMQLSEDALYVEPGETIRIQGAQLRGARQIITIREADDFQWFSRAELLPGAKLMGHRLHFGVEYTLSRLDNI